MTLTPRPIPVTTPPATIPADKATLAGSIAEAVKGVPGVARLTGGGDVVEVATLLPGRKVVGVRLGETVEIHMVAKAVPLPPVAEEAKIAAKTVLDKAGDKRLVEVFIEDIEGI
jgi:hypothetical protein